MYCFSKKAPNTKRSGISSINNYITSSFNQRNIYNKYSYLSIYSLYSYSIESHSLIAL